MASIRISQLAEVTSVTNDDVFVINDGDINTRKITFANLAQGLVPLDGNSTITGDLTLSGTLTSAGLVVDGTTLVVDTVNNRVGINTATPEYNLDVLGDFQLRGNGIVRLNDPNNQHAVTLQAPVRSADTAYAFPNA